MAVKSTPRTTKRGASKPTRGKTSKTGRWFARATRDSDALDLEKSVFTLGSARRALPHL
jgi:hypothetical protein